MRARRPRDWVEGHDTMCMLCCGLDSVHESCVAEGEVLSRCLGVVRVRVGARAGTRGLSCLSASPVDAVYRACLISNRPPWRV